MVDHITESPNLEVEADSGFYYVNLDPSDANFDLLPPHERILNHERVEAITETVVQTGAQTISERTAAGQHCYYYLPLRGGLPFGARTFQELANSQFQNFDMVTVRTISKTKGGEVMIELRGSAEEPSLHQVATRRGRENWEFNDPQEDKGFHLLVDDIVDKGDVLAHLYHGLKASGVHDDNFAAITGIIKAGDRENLSTYEELENRGISRVQTTQILEPEVIGSDGKLLYFGAIGEPTWYFSAFGMNSNRPELDHYTDDPWQRREIEALERSAGICLKVKDGHNLSQEAIGYYRDLLERNSTIATVKRSSLHRNLAMIGVMQNSGHGTGADIAFRLLQDIKSGKLKTPYQSAKAA